MPTTSRSRLPVLAARLAAPAFALAAALAANAAAQELGIPQGSGQQARAASARAASAQAILMPALTAGAARALSVLSSQDGANFTSLASETWTPLSGSLADPALVRHADGRYLLAYASGAGSVGLATSTDLRRWDALREIRVVPNAGQVGRPNWVRGADGQLHLVLTVAGGAHVLTPDDRLAAWPAPAPMRGLENGYADTVVAADGKGYVAVAREERSAGLVLARADSIRGPWRVDAQALPSGVDAGARPAGLVRLGAALRLYLRSENGARAWYADSEDGGRGWSEARRLTGTAAMASSFGVTGEPAQALAAATAAKGRPKAVEWDQYSLKVDGKRVVVWSGEIHPFRLPNPALWRDVIQKMKALGFNGVAFYFDWGYHSPAPGVYDFSGVRNVERALQIAQEEGMYVIARTGPYVNAELTGGGYPGWMFRSRAEARTDDPVYLAAVDEWMTQINAIIARHQVTDGGGNVIAYQLENELGKVEPKHVRQMEHLARKARADGIRVPFFHNAAGRLPDWTPKDSSAAWANPGPTELYAFDGYPGGSCDVFATPAGANKAPDWGIYAQGSGKVGALSSPDTPGFAAELGGGWFDYWGSNGTYACTAERQGKGYQRVFYGTNLINRITIHNIYMTFGGTSWGWLAGPVVYTSYDYGAAISEDRGLRPKAYALKQQGMFVQAAEQVLAEMDKGPELAPAGGKVKVYHNLNRRLGTHVIFAAHNPADGKGEEAFSVKLATRDGDYTIASTLRGQDARMLLAAYDMERQHLVYSTSELQTHFRNGERDIVLLHGRDGIEGETVLRYAGAPSVEVLAGQVKWRWDAARGDLVLNYVHDGLARVRISGGGRAPMLLLLADEATSLRFWTQDTGMGRALQLTPALVRSATIADGKLALRGDTSEDSAIEIWGPAFESASFNGQDLALTRQPDGSVRAATLKGPEAVRLPDLTRLAWMRRMDSLESAPGFDDSAWLQADRRPSVAQTWTMPERGQPTLAMSDYGFHHGDVWYRGRFTASDPKANQLELFYGAGGAGLIQVWIDGRFVGQHELDVGRSFPETTDSIRLSLGALRPGEHVVSVMVRNNAHNWNLMADDFHREARGLISASLTKRGGQRFAMPIAWRIQGRQGGEELVDRLRGPMNNGGLYGERQGWNLPKSPAQGWKVARSTDAPPAPGTYWLRTSFRLDLPREHDVQLGLAFGDASKPRSERENRALIFVNGWNMGQFIAHVGPQRTFVIPPGILNPNGENTVALAVTTDGRAGNALEPVRLVKLRAVRGGVALEMMQ
ncbi:beta-galactosidase [Massilia sp. 9I]|uniref:beta-galactosidase n=1 Tax=Massilia sp. 9I TaxID=2653152 RepID=UPI0012F37C01|nr:beta-galactosidase [Massilia sp. 9I]VXA98082.1 Beta-galactosidase [Massilia sp. 9I]